MSPAPFVIQPGTVRVRHIKQVPAGTAGATQVLNAWYLPQPEGGFNGDGGFVRGSYELRLGEEGAFSLAVPNDVGGDGVLHRDRFLIVTEKKAYRPGREWLEIYLDDDLLFVGTPTDATIGSSRIELSGFDCLELMKKVRETQAGFHVLAPRDAFEHYTEARRALIAEGLDTTPAGWVFQGGATQGAGKITLPVADNGAGGSTAPTFYTPYLLPGGDAHWRYEVEIPRINLLSASTALFVALQANEIGQPRIQIRVFGSKSGSAGVRYDAIGGGDQPEYTQFTTNIEVRNGSLPIAIERRGRWLFFYVASSLVSVRASPSAQGDLRAYVEFGGAIGSVAEVTSVSLRTRRPFLLRGVDKGDYRLPGAPTPGGLVGEYFDDSDLRTSYDIKKVLSPSREPYARRLDPQINFAAGFLPAGTTGDYVSARWTGAVKLDGNPSTYRFRLANLDDSARLWVGKTRLGEQIIDRWVAAAGVGPWDSGYLAGLGSDPGWFPIILEFAEQTGGESIVLQYDSGGGFVTIPADKLSPLGVYQAHVRGDSHYEQIKALARDFGYQFRVEPRQLESGEFPGQIIPRVRVGRDTDYILDEDEARDAQVKISAGDTVDSLLVDGQGTGADDQSQLTVSMTNYAGLIDQLIVHEDYESMPDMGRFEQVLQRLTSVLALRSSPLEELQAHPAGQRVITDAHPEGRPPQPTFSLSGVMALFRWLPGDGLRVSLPKLTVEDLTNRQLMSVQRDFVPGGLAAPSVGFRARPRGIYETLRQLIRQVMQRDRNYQGTTAIVTGNTASHPAQGSVPDVWSRVPLPANLDDVIAATLVVGHKSDGSTMNIDIHTGAAAARTFASPGPYDITPWVKARTDAMGTGQPGPMMMARASGGTGSAEYHVELLVRT